eukprot:c18732_g1_i2.p1 GENE.c18732_g1_i2~~c18732_g1_i2.p1  ORF type:complete len:305 (+),score=96.90 c18732_g1_i2:63-977(+)
MKVLCFFLFCLVFVNGSPEETREVYPNFYESIEMTIAFGKDNPLKNGATVPLSKLVISPSWGPMCGANSSKNYTLVMLSTDDIGSFQRALMVVGNMPGGLQGTIKLPYLPITSDYLRQIHSNHIIVFALFEMNHFLPRFFPGNCTEVQGLKLFIPTCPKGIERKDCPAPVYIPDDDCNPWKGIPQHQNRNEFNLESFGKSNNFTIVDILWFKTVDDTKPSIATNTATTNAATKPAQSLIEKEIPILVVDNSNNNNNKSITFSFQKKLIIIIIVFIIIIIITNFSLMTLFIFLFFLNIRIFTFFT